MAQETGKNSMTIEAAQPGGEVGWLPIETAPKDGTHILIGTFREPMPIGFGWCGKPARHQPWQAVVHYWDGASEEGFYLSTGDTGGVPITDGTHWRPLPDGPKE